jgi:hypothetical protein
LQALEVTTTHALKIAALAPDAWRMAFDQGHYTCAPPSFGNQRTWDVDDVVCLTWFRALSEGVGIHRSAAGKIVACLRDALQRDPDARSFRVFCIENGTTAVDLLFVPDGETPEDPRAGDEPIFTFDVAAYRRTVRAGMKAVQNARR